MLNFLKKSAEYTIGVISVAFTIIPESFFGNWKIMKDWSDGANILLIRVICILIVFLLSILLYGLYLKCRKRVVIKNKNYTINIQYGDLFLQNNCKKVIPFDECFTTIVGQNPGEIKQKSICGQYLMKNPIHNMQDLISRAQLKPLRNKSKYKGKQCYASGMIIPNGEFLFLAFAKLQTDGKGYFSSREEYLKCLKLLWEEIDKYYGQEDVAIPILGGGLTRIGDVTPTQQELLDMIIFSYKSSSHKIKKPYKLNIICKKDGDEEVSLNKIGENL